MVRTVTAASAVATVAVALSLIATDHTVASDSTRMIDALVADTAGAIARAIAVAAAAVTLVLRVVLAVGASVIAVAPAGVATIATLTVTVGA